MSTAADLTEHVMSRLAAAREASFQLAQAATSQKNEALGWMAEALWRGRTEILQANAADVAAMRSRGQPDSLVDRLHLDERRLGAMMEGLQQVAELPDPVGERLEVRERPNGLRIEKVRVPLGVVAMIYEARPNVTVDAAGLCLKTGNAVVLRGGRSALQSNRAIVRALRRGLEHSQLPPAAVQLVERVEHETVDLLITARGQVNLVIPRGGAGLIQRVVEGARVPVIETGVGNCHVYVDRAADPEMAIRIIVNAKAQRPSVCNAAETLLVHRDLAPSWLPKALPVLMQQGVELRACEVTRQLCESAGLPGLLPATEADWEEEFLAPILAVKTVTSLEDAMGHIRCYGTNHSEVIVTEDKEAATAFLVGVDAAVVYHNASSRFTDGFEFGFGAEIGIATGRLHARGPMGLPELTSSKYVVYGSGQVRPS